MRYGVMADFSSRVVVEADSEEEAITKVQQAIEEGRVTMDHHIDDMSELYSEELDSSFPLTAMPWVVVSD